MKRNSKIKRLLLAVLIPVLAGCSAVFDDSDCVSSYNLVRFTFDHNLKFTDVFDHEFRSAESGVSLIVFDAESGEIVKRIDALHSELTDNNELALDIAPGRYHLLVWGGEHTKSFDLADETKVLSDFHLKLRRDVDEASESHVNKRVMPLFHGLLMDLELPWASPSKPNRVTVPLVKDTNTFRIVLQQLSSDEPMLPKDFAITMTDNNGWLNSDNSLRTDCRLTYHPFHTASGSADINKDINNPDKDKKATTGNSGKVSAIMAEVTLSRLMDKSGTNLTIVNTRDGKTVLSINTLEWVEIMKGYDYASMDFQNYLDRQDEYNMTFFLDGERKWISTTVIINNWRIVRNDTPLE